MKQFLLSNRHAGLDFSINIEFLKRSAQGKLILILRDGTEESQPVCFENPVYLLTQIQRGFSLNFNSFAQLISFRVHFLLNHKDHMIGRERTDDLCFY